MHEVTHYWHWLLAVYLFLGGLAAACAYVGTFAEAFSKGRLKKVAEIGSYCVLPIIVLSLIILVLDLARPLQFWRFIITFRPSSLMSQGTWLLTLFAIFGGVITPAFFLSEKVDALSFLKGKDGARKVCQWIGAILGIGVAGYTGVLLSVKALPMWGATPFLPAVFVASATSTGIALILLIANLQAKKDEVAIGVLEKADAIVIAFEAIAFAVLIIALKSTGGLAADAAAVLLSGEYAMMFWIGVVIVALLGPLALELYGISAAKKAHPPASLTTLACISVLVGGFIVRWMFMYGGQVVR